MLTGMVKPPVHKKNKNKIRGARSMNAQWKKVHVFISSTFNDMHAERDYLIKNVFPKLREWCEKRKLRLIDIDLRWGVTEQDALYNKNVVKVCLDRIDDCRPFFICFLGQRRGWVPDRQEISADTLTKFPKLAQFVGTASVTEMEILHALVDPFHRGNAISPEKSNEEYQPARHSFIYLRDGSYINDLPSHPSQIRNTYTNEGIKDAAVRELHESELQRWRDEELPSTGRPIKHYSAVWDPHSATPELALPLASPSNEEVSVDRWCEQWKQAGIVLPSACLDIEEIPTETQKAHQYNRLLTAGRLCDFQVSQVPLDKIIIEDLQRAIAERFPEHMEISDSDILQKEIDQNEQFLFISSEGFIKRDRDFQELDSYVSGDSNQLFVLSASGGVGKSTLLANWIDHHRNSQEKDDIHFRFIGQSDLSTTAYSLLFYLLKEIKDVTGKIIKEIPADPQKLYQEWISLLEGAGKKGKLVIVMDALNQLTTGLSDLSWLPAQLPGNIKIIVSIKRGEPEAEDFLHKMGDQIIHHEVTPFVEPSHRRALINAYLDQYLKQLDETHLETLTNLPGANNPLYLKVILSELRVFGAFANLGQKIESDFGEDPISAFIGVLDRLEQDPSYSPIDPIKAVPLLFGLLAHAQHGLAIQELAGMFIRVLELDNNEFEVQAVTDTIHLLLRQVRPFIANREGRYDFFFESFKLAVLKRYIGDETPKRAAKEWHSILAEYFTAQPIGREVDGEIKTNSQKLIEQPYQQVMAEQWDEFKETYTNFDFMEKKCTTLSSHTLEIDLALALERWGGTQSDREILIKIEECIRSNSQHLQAYPELLAAILTNHLSWLDSPGDFFRALCKNSMRGRNHWLRSIQNLKPEKKSSNIPIIGHTDEVTAVTFCADGKQMLSASKDKTCILWDIATGKAIRSFAGHSHTINSVAVSPDGVALLTGSEDKTIKLWDIQTGELIRTFDVSSAIGIKTVNFSPDGKTIIAGGILIPVSFSKDGKYLVGDRPTYLINRSDGKQLPTLNSASKFDRETFALHNAQTGQAIQTLKGKLTAAFLPDSKHIVTFDDKLILYDCETGEKIQEYFDQPQRITAVAISPNGKTIVSVSWDAHIKVWEISSGKLLHTFEINQGKAPRKATSVSISPDGNYAICGLDNHTIILLDLTNYKTIKNYGFPKIVKGIDSISPDCETIIKSLDQSYSLSVLEGSTGQKIHTLTGHTDTVYAISHTNDGEKAISQANDMSILWNLKTGEMLASQPHQKEFYYGFPALISSDDKTAIIGTTQNSVLKWDLETNEVWQIFAPTRLLSVSTIVFSPDGQGVIAESIGAIKHWSLQSGEEKQSFGGYSGRLNQLAVSRDGKKLIGSNAKSFFFWNIESGELLRMINAIQEDSQQLGTWLESNNNELIISITTGKNIKVWEQETGRLIQTINDQVDQTSSIIVSRDSKTLFAILRSTNTINIWDISTGKLKTSITTLKLWKSEIGLTPDDRKILYVPNNEKTVQLFDAETGQNIDSIDTDQLITGSGRLHSIEGNNGGIYQTAISSDENLVASQSLVEKSLKTWEIDTGELKKEVFSLGAVSLSADANFGIIKSQQQEFSIYNLQTGNLISSLQNCPKEIYPINFSPDNSLVIGAFHKDNKIFVWDAATGHNITSFNGPEKNVISLIATSDNRRVISSSEDNIISVWDLKTGKRLHSLIGHEGRIKSFSLSKDENVLISWTGNSSNAEIILWDVNKGKLIIKHGGIYSPSLTNTQIVDDKILELKNRELKISNLYTREMLQSFEIGEDVIFKGISKNRFVLVSDRPGQRFQLWDYKKGRLEQEILFPPDADKNISISPDGKTAISGTNTRDHRIILWDLKTGKVISSFQGHTYNIASLEFSPDGKEILSGSYDKSIKIWNIRAGELRNSLEGHNQYITKAIWSADGKYIASISGDKSVKFWDAKTGKVLWSFDENTHLATAIAISPDDQYVVFGTGNSITAVDAQAGKKLYSFNQHKTPISHISVLEGGKSVVSLSSDRIVIWDYASGEIIRLHEALYILDDLVISSDGKIAVGGNLKVWDLQNGRVIKSTTNSIAPQKIYLSEKSNSIIHTHDKAIVLWNLSSNESKVLIRNDSKLSTLTVSNSEQYIVCGDDGGKVWIFEWIK